jgi:hypothetical protein
MNAGRRRLGRAAAAATLAAMTACGGGPSPPPPARPFADPGYADAGGYRLHYGLTLTRDLPRDIARSYGIVQRRNLALLTATLAPRDAATGEIASLASIEATAVALTGERTPLAVARHDEKGVPTWLATIEVRDRVPVTIEIRARASPTSPEIRVRLTREFGLD